MTQSTIFNNVGVAAHKDIFTNKLFNYFMTKVFVEQPLTSSVSAYDQLGIFISKIKYFLFFLGLYF